MSLLIYGAQANKGFSKQRPLKVRYDILYSFNFTSGAHFNSDTNTVVFGANTVNSEFLGIQPILRHEIAHAFQDIKTRNGELSLSRIQLANWESSESFHSYETYLRADELETFLRDLRWMLRAGREANNKRLIKSLSSPETVAELPDVRKVEIDHDILVMEGLISRVREALHHVKLELRNPQATVNRVTYYDYGVADHLKNVPGRYPLVVLILEGLHGQDPDQLIRWSERRIDQIEAELKTLKIKASRL